MIDQTCSEVVSEVFNDSIELKLTFIKEVTLQANFYIKIQIFFKNTHLKTIIK